MSLHVLTWKDLLDEFYADPQKALAWLLKLFWDAEIEPEEIAQWDAKAGLIQLGQSRLGHAVVLRLCNECRKHVRWTQVTAVGENECQCVCHKMSMESTK